MRIARRIVGGALIALALVPFWYLLSSRTAPIAQETVRIAREQWLLLLRGTVLIVTLSVAISLVIPRYALERAAERFRDLLLMPRNLSFALVLGALSGFSTAAVSWYVWSSAPVFVDALAQFVHARYFTEGVLAAAGNLPFEFWVVANTFVTDAGWVSQYPPGHIAAIAIGFTIGAVWLVFPILLAVAAVFTSLSSERLFPHDVLAARLGALLFALSPLLLTLAATYMSHVTVVALLAVAGYLSLRARDGTWTWAIGAGVAVGAAFATRPLSALVIGAVLTVGIWLTSPTEQGRMQRLGIRTVAAALGALPLAVVVALYNAKFFGSPFRFGYTAYLGPAHGMGFHTDPLGNPFGPAEGLAFTSSDLTALGYFLLRTPVSAVLVAGLYLLLARGMTTGARIVTAWALSLIVPLGMYWHHDLMIGPRMLSDATPAWCLLVAIAGMELIRMAPADHAKLGKLSPRLVLGVACVSALLLGAGYFTPRDMARYRRTFDPAPSLTLSEYPTIVFVHDSWTGRIVARLLAGGMRADSVNMALANNSTCSLHGYSLAHLFRKKLGGPAPPHTIAFSQQAADGSEPRQLPFGVTVRAKPGEELSEACLREAHADSLGTLPLMPLLWQGDLPAIPHKNSTMFVRDLGPEANVELLRRYPRRRPAVLLRRPEDGRPALVSYDEGMRMLWGESNVGP